jgi:hypothetical protein
MPARFIAEDSYAAVGVLETQNVALVNKDNALNVTPMLASSFIPKALGVDSTSMTTSMTYGDDGMKGVGRTDKIQPKAIDVYGQKFDLCRAASPITRQIYSSRGSALLFIYLFPWKMSRMLWA